MPFWSGITDWIGNAAGSVGDALGTAAERYAGINDTKYKAPPIDYNAYQLGIGGQSADQAGMRYQALGQQAMNKAAPNVYTGQYVDDRALEMQGRGLQGEALGMTRDLAEGRGPSLAAIQAQQGMKQAMAQQAAISAGARGGGANLAAAQQAAAAGAANAAGQIQRAAALARAQEQLGAINQFAGQAGAMRGADAARAAQSGQMGVAQGNVYLGNQGQGYQFAQGMENLGFQTGAKQLEANTARDTAIQAGDRFRQTGNAEVNAANTKATADTIQKVGNAAIGAVASDERLKDDVHALGSGYGGASGYNEVQDKFGVPGGGVDWKAASEAMPSAYQGGGMRQGGMMQQGGALGRLFSDEHSKEKIAGLEGLVAHLSTQKQNGMARPTAPSVQADGSVFMPDGSVQRSTFAAPPGPTQGPAADPYDVWRSREDRGQAIKQMDAYPMALTSDAHSKERIESLMRENYNLNRERDLIMADPQANAARNAAYERHLDRKRQNAAEDQAALHDDRPTFNARTGEREMVRFQRAPAAEPPPPTPVGSPPGPPVPGVVRRALGSALGSVQGAVAPAAATYGGPPAPTQPMQLAPVQPPPMQSDERSKVGTHGTPMEQFMDHLKPVSYHYKDGVPGEDPTKPRAGVLAQDVEKSDVGDTFVEDTPGGKQLDVTHGFGVALGALGDLNKRLKALEGKKGRR